MEGRVPLREFAVAGKPAELKVGDDGRGLPGAHRERARRGRAVARQGAPRGELDPPREEVRRTTRRSTGVIFNKVKGGFTVDLDGAVAFLPGSQVDIRPVRDIGPLMHQPQPFQILKMDRRRGNIVVSRRAVLEETRAEQRAEIVARLEEGQVIDGLVKNITDYGAFIDLGGIDGLLHVTDMAWRRVNHPSEIVNVGDTVKVQIIRINPETQRISLGMKQLQADPWAGIEAKYPVGARFKGTVTNIADYGAFVELEPGVEGLIHVSEMSWTKKNIHPGKIVSTSQQVEVQVLEVDRQQAPHLARPQADPGQPVGCLPRRASRRAPMVEGPIRNITEFGLFIGLDGGVDGMVHLSDLDWNKPGDEAIKDYKKGDNVKAVVLDVDSQKERISLGIKQLGGDPLDTLGKYKKGDAGHLRGRRGAGERHRGEDRRQRASPPSSSAPTCRATAPSSGPSASTSATRSTPPSPASTRPAAASRCRSRRSRSPRRSRPWRSTARPTRGASLGDIFKAAIEARERRRRGREGGRQGVSRRLMPAVTTTRRGGARPLPR